MSRFDRRVGIGAVMAEIAWIQACRKEKGAPINDLERGIMDRYKISSDGVKGVIDMAYHCGVAREEDGIAYLLSREGEKL